VTTDAGVSGADLRVVANLAAMTAVLSWGIGNVLIKLIDAGGLTLGFHRLWMASVLTGMVLLARGGRPTRREVRVAAPSGVAFALNTACMFTALKLTTVANASVIAALQPVVVMFVATRRFGERVRVADVVLVATAVAGVAFVVFGSSGLPEWRLAGDVVAVLSLVTFSWYFVESKRARRQISALPHQMTVAMVGVVVLLPILLASAQGVALPGGSAWLGAALLVIIPGGGHFLMSWAHGHTSLSLTSLLTLGTPVVATIGAAIVLDERVTVVQAVGIGVVLVSLAVLIARSSMFSPPVVAEGQAVPRVTAAPDAPACVDIDAADQEAKE
jgi:drug/metabolite transporter (DMT)-like permease